MQEILHTYLITYGYLAIFCLVLMQESGVPGLPNELVLFYFGYLSHQAHLWYPVLICLVIAADILGSFLLYFLFYFGSGWLLRIKPAWLKLPVKRINALKARIAERQGKTIFIGKLTPFIRGYIPVAAGMLQMDPYVYGKNILVPAIVWSGGWLTAGWLFFTVQ
ncbi:MAG: VTT domain-containing protein [Bacteroidota bacterium]